MRRLLSRHVGYKVEVYSIVYLTSLSVIPSIADQ
jgi:hypothetical protein